MNKDPYLIKNAEVFNGRKIIGIQDILVENGMIKQIHPHILLQSIRTIEATGKTVSPGFIDVHTHADLAVAFTDCINFLSQGVTTIVTGNCGINAGPDNGSKLQGIINFADWAPDAWGNFGKYQDWLSNRQLGVNCSAFIGFHSLICESKNLHRSPVLLLEKYLQNGAAGLSLGFDYGYNKNVPADDLAPLIRLVNQHNAIVSVHLKNQGAGLFQSVKEMLELFRDCKNPVRLEISHLKHKFFLDPQGHKTLSQTLELIESFQKQGYQIATDAYPYDAGSTALALALENPEFVKQCQNGWNDIYPAGSNLSIGQLAEAGQISEINAVKSIVEKNPATVAVYRNTMREGDIWEILAKGYCRVGSDGLPTHPRNCATFTKVLRKVREKKWDKEFWLKKMTGGPAEFFGLPLGTIEPGQLANLVLFDWQNISDRATFADPANLSEGIELVWVSGNLAYSQKDGVLNKSGKIFKRKIY